MGVLYARVGGAWVPVIAPAAPAVDEVWVGPAAPTASETELWVDADQTPAPMLYAKIAGNWTSVSSPPTNEVAVQAAEPTGSEELWYDTDAPGYTPDDLRWMSAWGVISRTAKTANQGGFTSTTAPGEEITGLGTSVNVIAGRRYRITCDPGAYADLAGVQVNFLLRLNRTYTMQQCNFPLPVAGWGNRNYMELIYAPAVSALETWTVNIQLTYGSGTYAVNATPSQPMQLVIEDIGPVVNAAPTSSPLIDRWNTAWGIVAMGSASSGTVPANVVTNIGSVTGPIVAGRRYKLTAKTRATTTSPPAGANLRWAGQDVTANDTWAWVGGNYQSLNHDLIFTASATGTYTWTLAASCTATGWYLYFDYQCSFVTLEDLGPASGAVPIPNPTPAWLPLTLQNSWANLGGGTTYTPASYRKIGDDVQLHGLVSGGSVNATIATLPVGYRPLRVHHLGTVSFDLIGVARIELDGRIVPTTGNSGWFSLDGLTFSVSV